MDNLEQWVRSDMGEIRAFVDKIENCIERGEWMQIEWHAEHIGHIAGDIIPLVQRYAPRPIAR